MTKYLELEAAVQAFKNFDAGRADSPPCTLLTPEEFAEYLYELPTADVAPVVHGRWEWLGPNRLVTDCMCGTCSVCKVRSKYIVNTMLCPNCGACMDGGDSNACL